MTINRRTMLTGAALAPFVPVVAAAGESDVSMTVSEWMGQVRFPKNLSVIVFDPDEHVETGIVVAQTASEEQRQQTFRVGTSAADRRNPPKRAT